MGLSNIQIRHSTTSNTPNTLLVGEIAYSYPANTLYIGDPANGVIMLFSNVVSNLSSVSEDISPNIDNFYTLGSPIKRWKSVYVGPGSMFLQDTATGNNAELTVTDGILFVGNISGLRLGDIQFTNTGLTVANLANNITMGTPNATGFLQTFIPIEFPDGSILASANINGGTF